jgi:hypothetical protein
MKYNKNQRSNLKGLPLNRFENDIPKEMWVTEGEDYHSVKPKLTPYDTNIYDAIEYAISTGLISTTGPLRIYNNDAEAILAGLEDGDSYELASTNDLTTDPTFNTNIAGLVKIVRINVILTGTVLGAVFGGTTAGFVLGAGLPPDPITGAISILGIN